MPHPQVPFRHPDGPADSDGRRNAPTRARLTCISKRAINLHFHHAQVGQRRAGLPVHRKAMMVVEVEAGPVHPMHQRRGDGLDGLPDIVPAHIDERHVHHLRPQIELEYLHRNECFAQGDGIQATCA